MNPLARKRRLHILWRRRFAITSGAVLLGLLALGFAKLADLAHQTFLGMAKAAPYAPLFVVPLGFALIAYITQRWAPAARGSGIPQVIAGSRDPDHAVASGLLSLKTAVFKVALTIAGLLVGASVGREGPTVQISAALMARIHQLLRVRVTTAVVIAGGGAGVSAAFNTPLAGVAFAIEELAAAYEQRLALLVMAAVMIAGLVSLGIAGDYLYFGAMHDTLSFRSALLIASLAGVFGGLCGGLFSRAMLTFNTWSWAPFAHIRRYPVAWAAGCGLVVAIIGVAGSGLTWGTGYEPAKALIEGQGGPLWFGLAKFVSTLLTSLSGLPGGIFAPALATGAGVGDMLAVLFPDNPRGAVVLLGMIAYFVGVVRAPLTAVLIVSEMTDSRAMILPLFVAAIIADGVSALVCRERLYHGLSKAFRS